MPTIQPTYILVFDLFVLKCDILQMEKDKLEKLIATSLKLREAFGGVLIPAFEKVYKEIELCVFSNEVILPYTENIKDWNL